jgi:hypothetical protein
MLRLIPSVESFAFGKGRRTTWARSVLSLRRCIEKFSGRWLMQIADAVLAFRRAGAVAEISVYAVT